MNVKYEQFIGIYEETFSKEYCESVINYFENMVSAGHGFNRQQQNFQKQDVEDLAVFGHSEKIILLPHSITLQKEFNDIFWGKCYSSYADKFEHLKSYANHSCYSFKIQKTEPGQGYHMWHSESSARGVCNRILAWTLYLNDVEEGGETEFIYQHLRIKPKTGTVIIWPAGFTHAHRGNPPISGDKYIITGWIEF